MCRSEEAAEGDEHRGSAKGSARCLFSGTQAPNQKIIQKCIAYTESYCYTIEIEFILL